MPSPADYAGRPAIDDAALRLLYQLARGRGDTGLGATVHRGAVAFLQRDDRSVGGEEIELRRCEIAVPFPEMHVERHAVPREIRETFRHRHCAWGVGCTRAGQRREQRRGEV